MVESFILNRLVKSFVEYQDVFAICCWYVSGGFEDPPAPLIYPPTLRWGAEPQPAPRSSKNRVNSHRVTRTRMLLSYVPANEF
jgi:hypothetical protein